MSNVAKNQPVSSGPEGSDGDEAMPADVAEMLEAAEAAVNKLRSDYIGWLRQDVAKIESLLGEAREETGDRAPLLERIYAVSHDVKGQGGSFGYDLATEIGQSLCDLIKKTGAGTDTGLAAIEAHVAALNCVVDQGLDGDGGETGTALLSRLRQAAASLAE